MTRQEPAVESTQVVPLLDDLGRFAVELAHGSDAESVLANLASSLQRVLHLAGVTVLVPSEGDPDRSLVAGSPPELAELERYQVRRGTGPSMQATRTGEDVLVDLGSTAGPWGELLTAAAHLGLCTLADVPMFWEGRSFGSIGLYADTPRSWGEPDLTVARFMGTMASASLTTMLALDQQRTLASQLQRALDSRVIIEQAKGILAASEGISVEDAFDRIRRHARRNSITVAAVADAVVNLRLRPAR